MGRDARDRHAHGSLERTRIAHNAGGNGVSEGLRRRDDERRHVRGARFRIARAERELARERRVHLAGDDPAVRFDEPGARGDEIDEGAGLAQDLEHLSRRCGENEIEPRRHALRFEQHGRREHVAERDPAVPAENDLAHGLAGQVAHRAHVAGFVAEERIDRGQIHGDHFVARCARIGHEGAVRLGAALIAQKDLGLFVTHEEGGRGSQLRRDAAKHRALAHRQEARARPCKLEDHRRMVLRLDAAHDLGQPAAEQLQSDVARTDEGADSPGEQDLHAAGRAQGNGPQSERLTELTRRGHEGEHAGSAHGSEPWDHR